MDKGIMWIDFPPTKECKHKYKYVLCVKCNNCDRFNKRKTKKKKVK